jgi:uncharacterized protein YjaG (DUF416 family)
VLAQHRQVLIRGLRRLPRSHRAAFAALTAGTLVPNYREFSQLENWGEPAVLELALDEVWRCIEEGKVSADRHSELMRESEKQAPDTERFGEASASAALDAVSATVAALAACQTDSPESALQAAESAIDTVYMYVQFRDALDPNASDFDERVLQDPLMRAELQRQLSAVDMLRAQKVLDPNSMLPLRKMSDRPPLKF